MHSRSALLGILLSLAAVAPARAQAAITDAADTAPPPVARELRAVWVATVENMDWPSKAGLSTAQQQREMLTILDKLVQLHMNAIVLQVRPAADALYESPNEPWSDVLTGQMGQAPAPFYDPLAFAITEAHKRGLELHAWINPYRAKNTSTKRVSSDHVSRTDPELVRSYGSYLWLDPGDPKVRDLTTRVALDIVRRYDIDALHMDDYFYPYRESRNGREIEFPDESTWQRYKRGGGTLARDDWRRENVNLLVRQLYDAVHAVKPWVRFGISPFGIWRPGNPPSVRGLDQYAEIYADARKWLRQGWVDYFTPQLYWPVRNPQQRYDELLRWWVEQNVYGRNIWPGNYTGKVAFTNASAFRTGEILEQLRLTRAQPGATGNVHFSMKVFLDDPDALNEQLLAGPYASPALVPASPWLGVATPAAPVIATHTDAASGTLLLDVRPSAQPPAPVGFGGSSTLASTPWLWVVQTRGATGWSTAIVPGGERTRQLAARGAPPPREVRVMMIDRIGNASPPATLRAPF
ncbi:MAG: family 10 glycosylhydrolase [bacterium]